MKADIYYLHVLTALHVGIGEGSGVIDLPIARERASHLPVIPGSGIKGVLRYEMSEKKLDKDIFRAMFGPGAEQAAEHAGALAVGDARLLCLPVRSLRGTFAWATCPLILHRFQRDISNIRNNGNLDVPEVPGEDTAYHTSDSVLAEHGKIFLEDLDLSATYDERAERWAEHIARHVFHNDETWQRAFRMRFVVLSDSVFDFISDTATEIRARVKIQEGTRTVQTGGLWYEENLPAESILWGVIAADRSRYEKCKMDGEAMLAKLPREQQIQIGGNATIGGGRVRWLGARGSSS